MSYEQQHQIQLECLNECVHVGYGIFQRTVKQLLHVYLLFCCFSFELLFFSKGSMICWYNILDGIFMKFLCWENHLCLKECFCITALNLSWLRYPSLHDVWMIWSWISLLLPPFHYFKGKVVLKLCVRIPIVEQTDGTCQR